jgi:hypothetical protein
MKKFLLIAAAALLFSAPSFAQNNVYSIFDVSPAVEAKCTNITRSMAHELRLNEPEYIKLKELNRERIVKTDALLQSFKENDPELNQQMKEIELAYEQQIASFLKPDQLHAYINYKQAISHVKFVAAVKE